MKVEVALKANCTNNKNPTVNLSINDIEHYTGEIADIKHFVFEFDSYDHNTLKIKHYNKTNQDTIVDAQGNITGDLSIELVSIHIDNIKIMDTVLYSMPFFVQWPDNMLEDYRNKNQEPPEYIDNNLYFGFNGVYQFSFSGDVVSEYYNQFWLDEVQAHKNQTQQDNDSEVFDRMGEKVAVDENSEFTIYDLEKLVLIDNQ
jgi:hypothetical protein